MAKKISDYPDSPAIVTTFPNGKLVDESGPGANDGTLLRQLPIQDIWTVFSKLMDNASLTWSGSADTQTSSQFFEALLAGVIPVGSTMQSFLTEAQFNAQPGYAATKWVLCDGRSVAGSRYHTITGVSTVPNALGRFLRSTATADASLKTTQANQIGTHTHTVATHTHPLSSNGQAALNLSESGGTITQTIKRAGSSWTASGVQTWTGTDASNTDAQGFGLALAGDTDTGGPSSTGSTTTGSTETRPDSIIVNTFIKIN